MGLGLGLGLRLGLGLELGLGLDRRWVGVGARQALPFLLVGNEVLEARTHASALDPLDPRRRQLGREVRVL